MRALACFSLLVLLFHPSFEQYQNQQFQQQRVNQQLPQGYNPQQSQQNQPPQLLQNQPQRQQQLQYAQQRGGQLYGQQNTNQQQFNGQMSSYNQNNQNQQQQQVRAGASASVVNTPIRLVDSSTTANGAQVQIRLTSYQNPTMALSNTTTCSCPTTYCDFLPQNQQNACSFSFVTVISSAFQSVQYVQSDFNPFSGSISTGNWTTPHTFQMINKPVAIDIFVQHLGVTIDRTTGCLLYFGRLTLVDCFIVDLSQFKSSTGGEQSLSLTGTQLGTQLQLTLNIQCINGMMGDMCDMSCTPPKTTSNFAICTNNRTGDYFNCTYNSYTAQVSQCVLCAASGTAFNGTCVVPIKEVYLGVSTAFRIWTIVLGCLLGIAVLLILCLIISYIIVKNRERYDERSSYKATNVYTNGQTGRHLLEEEDTTKTTSMRSGRDRHEEGSTYKATKTTTAHTTNGRAGRNLVDQEEWGTVSRPVIQQEEWSTVRPVVQEEWTTVTRRPVATEYESSFIRSGVTTTTISRQEHQV